MTREQAKDRLARAEAARRDGNPLALYDLSQDAIDAGEPSRRYLYLRTLALAQMGDLTRAEEHYARDGLETWDDDEDAMALRGRLFKDRAYSASAGAREDLLRKASAAYSRAYQIRQGYFPAINAATTAWEASDKERAMAWARLVLGHREVSTPSDFFSAASRAEALVLLGRIGEAQDAIVAALQMPDAGHGVRAAAYRQLERLCADLDLALEDQLSLLTALRPAPVITYTGHMFRSDPEERALAARIGAVMQTLGSTIAYGSLASGADILIAEEILGRAGELHVILPFRSEDFIDASVRPAGEDWVARFHACMAAAASIRYATGMSYVPHDEQFAYCARLGMGLAELRATQIAARSLQVAVWDSRPPRRGAGTAADVAAWRSFGRDTCVIDPGAIDRQNIYPENLQDSARSTHVIRAMIFADYKGFSKLPETAVPVFNLEVMGRIAAVLNRHSEAVCSRNTWGDAVYAVITEPSEAADIALEILESLQDVRIGPVENRQKEGMRVGLHFGPVYQAVDPVTGRDNFYGSEVTLAARIEPVAIPGEIYTTEAFAATLSATAPQRFACRYLGKIELAKQYGVLPIYGLERR